MYKILTLAVFLGFAHSSAVSITPHEEAQQKLQSLVPQGSPAYMFIGQTSIGQHCDVTIDMSTGVPSIGIVKGTMMGLAYYGVDLKDFAVESLQDTGSLLTISGMNLRTQTFTELRLHLDKQNHRAPFAAELLEEQSTWFGLGAPKLHSVITCSAR